MNKYKDALRILVQPYHSIKSKIKAENKILELIELSTPKKPRLKENRITKFSVEVCPQCGEFVVNNYRGEYCGCCGQAIDWSEDDE